MGRGGSGGRDRSVPPLGDRHPDLAERLRLAGPWRAVPAQRDQLGSVRDGVLVCDIDRAFDDRRDMGREGESEG